MTQIRAILLDAYRELNNRKLFWVVLILTGLFVLVYASIGFDEKGMFILFGSRRIDNELLTAGSPMSRLLYRGIFATFIVPVWLSWIATILALISTASIFPEFIAGGSIDLILSKPVKRLWLFLYKYFASLLFVLLQVSIVCVGAFLAMGWRLSDWDWRVFAAIPLVMLVYSYLFSITVLVGVWTRSTLAALLATLVVWFCIYAISATEGIALMFRYSAEARAEELSREIESDRLRSGNNPDNSAIQWSISTTTSEREKLLQSIDTIDRWLNLVRIIRWPMPKTSETVNLMDRMLAREGDINLMDLIQGRVSVDANGKPAKAAHRTTDDYVQNRIMQDADRPTPLFIIGSSLAFEFVILGTACFIFVRRDY